MKRALLALAMLAAASCETDDAVPSWTQTLPEGTYEVSGPVCISSGKRPRYPAPGYQAALYDFDDLEFHWLTIGPGPFLTETFADPDCRMTLERSLYRNAQTELTARAGKRHVFEPKGCALDVRFRDYSYPVALGYAEIVVDRDSREPDLAWYLLERSADGTTYTMVTDSIDSVANAWGAYGCEAADQLRKILKKH